MLLQAQRTLFIDPLDLWLQILGITMFLLAYWVYRYSKGDLQSIRPLGYGLITLGIYIVATGLWATFTWPLIGPYNIILSDSWPLLGVVLISLGLATIYGAFSRALFYIYAGLSLPIFVYGTAILYFRLTQEPEIASLLFMTVGLAGLLSPLIELKKKPLTYLVIVLLIIAGAVALFLGVNVTYSHIPGWRAWNPWYGKVVVQG